MEVQLEEHCTSPLIMTNQPKFGGIFFEHFECKDNEDDDEDDIEQS